MSARDRAECWSHDSTVVRRRTLLTKEAKMIGDYEILEICNTTYDIVLYSFTRKMFYYYRKGCELVKLFPEAQINNRFFVNSKLYNYRRMS